MIRTLALTLALLPAGLAAQTSAGMRALLSGLPMIPAGEGVEIGYGDLAAARALDVSAINGASTDPVILQLRALPPGQMRDYVSDPARAWRRSVGFAPGDVLRIATLTAPPAHAAVIDLAPGAGAAVGPALQNSGYSQETQGALTAWAARGEDFAVNLGQRNPDDPFGGHLGRSARVQVQGDRLHYGASWPLLAALGSEPPLATQSDVTALLDALDGLKGAGSLIGATLWTDARGLGLADPAAIVTGQAPMPGGPAPAWGMALFADLSDGPQSTGVLALTVTLPDAAAAEALRTHVQNGWNDRPSRTMRRTFAEMTGAPAQISVEPAGAGQWVLILSQTTPTAPLTTGSPLTRNPAFARLIDAAWSADLVFLSP